MTTMKQFVNKHHIHCSSTMVGENPDMPEFDGYHYKVILRRGNKQLTTFFSMGYGLSHEPTSADVLSCLAMDSAGIESAQNFTDWASEYGYDEDSRKAERIFHACEKQAAKLKQFLGEYYQVLLYDVEPE